MELDFWQQRWSDNQIGFHMPVVNPYLNEFWAALNVLPGSSVFVPLCGKSLDLVWFVSQHYSVLGIECSERAIWDFFAEQSIDVVREPYKSFTAFRGENLNLLHGDFFKLDKQALSSVAAVYDRASLVALPESMRSDYVHIMSSCLPEAVSILLVTLEYDQSRMAGPPFSVPDNEIHELYQPHFNIELLKQFDVLESQPRFRERGLDYMFERVYKISR